MTAPLRFAPRRSQQRIAAEPYHRWTLPDETVWTEFHRTPAGYLLRFPDLADFEISRGARTVTCHPAPSASEEACRHLFHNQVRPLMLAERGEVVLHASAVEVGGVAVAFAGPSGRGKSTLAAALALAGHRFLSDDGLAVRAAAEGFVALPSDAAIRLCDDAREALGADAVLAGEDVGYTAKRRVAAGGGMAFCGEPRRLARICFLGGDRDRVRLERISPREALVECCRNSFILDPVAPRAIARHFEGIAALSGGVECFRLAYPRRYDALPEVTRALAEDPCFA